MRSIIRYNQQRLIERDEEMKHWGGTTHLICDTTSVGMQIDYSVHLRFKGPSNQVGYITIFLMRCNILIQY